MGYINVVKSLIGLSPKVVSKHRDNDGYVWARDAEGFYFRRETVWVPIDGDQNGLHGDVYIEPIHAKRVPEEVRTALEKDGAGFVDETWVDQFMERWGGGPIEVANEKRKTTRASV